MYPICGVAVGYILSSCPPREHELVIGLECCSCTCTVSCTGVNQLLLCGHLVGYLNSTWKQSLVILAECLHLFGNLFVMTVTKEATDRSDAPFELDSIVGVRNEFGPGVLTHSGIGKCRWDFSAVLGI